MTETDLALARIRNYYTLVDQSMQIDPSGQTLVTNRGAAQAIAALFAPDAVYLRHHHLLQGQPAIAHFFAEERPLAGSHEIEKIEAISGAGGITVKVKGVFIGLKSEAEPTDQPGLRHIRASRPVVLDFADEWLLYDGRVTCRHSIIHERNRDIAEGIE